VIKQVGNVPEIAHEHLCPAEPQSAREAMAVKTNLLGRLVEEKI
jgi:hypothetical protein